jgi:PIN domain nuclease of toxin-antitoxin system
VILLDTHIWVWWVHDSSALSESTSALIGDRVEAGIGVSIMSCWEVAKLVQVGRLALPVPTADWLARALSYPGVQLLPLSPAIVVESTQLPGTFHRDPADQLIVATARVLGLSLVTADQRIREYQHVQTLPGGSI